MLPPVVYLEWVDSDHDPGWQDTDKVKAKRVVVPVPSVGFIVCEDDNSITITSSVAPDEVLSPLTIPKNAITKRRKVRL